MVAVDVDLKALVNEARAGEPGAWDALFQRYQLPLYTYVYELVREEQASLDIVQETFINAVRHLASLREERKFGSWLFGIAHQKCLQLWRRHHRAPLWVEEDLSASAPDPGPDPAECLLRAEQEERFLALLERLSTPHREVLLLHFVEDFSIEEISAITGTPPGTTKSRLHYAKEQLRKLLEEET